MSIAQWKTCCVCARPINTKTDRFMRYKHYLLNTVELYFHFDIPRGERETRSCYERRAEVLFQLKE